MSEMHPALSFRERTKQHLRFRNLVRSFPRDFATVILAYEFASGKLSASFAHIAGAVLLMPCIMLVSQICYELYITYADKLKKDNAAVKMLIFIIAVITAVAVADFALLL